MKIMTLFTGGGVSLSPQNAEGRRVSDYVRLVADEGMGITDGNTITTCVDTLSPSAWRDCEAPIVGVPIEEQPTAYTAEQLAEMTNAELSAILADLGISTDMDKDNMIDLILYKQNGGGD